MMWVGETAKAAVLVSKERIEIMEFEIPETGTDDGLLRVEACGVCGFDNEAYLNGGNGVFDLPCVMGHEVVGTIEKLGPEASKRWGVRTGDRVVIEEYIPCGSCDNCLSGCYHLCFELRYGAMSIHHPKTALWGGYADKMYLHPRSILHKVAQDTPAELLQLFIPISNGLHWAQQVGGVKSGDVVVIQGPGPMGLGSVIGAKEAGAAKIVVTGLSRDAERLKMAQDFGADHVLLADSQDIVEELKELTDGKMANVVINAATSRQAIVTALDLAGHRATVVHSGTDEQLSDKLMASKITWKLLTIKGVLGRPKATVDVALRLIESGRYPLHRMLTHKFSVEQTHEAIRTASYGLDGVVHVAVVNE